jgi:hypothetical protein
MPKKGNENHEPRYSTKRFVLPVKKFLDVDRAKHRKKSRWDGNDNGNPESSASVENETGSTEKA